MKYFSVIISFLFYGHTMSQVRLGDSYPVDSSKIELITKLGIPFGEIAKLEVEVYDGDTLLRKTYQGTFLLKINSINGKPLTDTLILRFTDETKTLASDDFGFYELMYKKKTGSISYEQAAKIRKKYVGKKFIFMAYETGQFKGTPDEYFDYKPTIPGVPKYFATRSFYFEHSLVLVSRLKK
jgi:hypothetical protein